MCIHQTIRQEGHWCLEEFLKARREAGESGKVKMNFFERNV